MPPSPHPQILFLGKKTIKIGTLINVSKKKAKKLQKIVEKPKFFVVKAKIGKLS